LGIFVLFAYFDLVARGGGGGWWGGAALWA